MAINAQRERRRDLKKQTPYPKKAIKKPGKDRAPATSGGIRQVISLASLPTLAKTVKLDEKAGELTLCWRLKMPDVRALKMIFTILEAKGWKVL